MVLLRHSGYSHVFHAILPPWVTKTNVSTWALCKHMPMDQQPSVYSHISEQKHVVGSYQVGDIVSYCREARAGEHGLQWSVGSRLIGFEKDRNSLGETQPRTSWVSCPSVLPLIIYDHARQRNCWLSTTRKPKVLHLLQRMFRYNKASSMNVLHSFRQFLIRHELPMKARTKTSGTTICQSQHN